MNTATAKEEKPKEFLLTEKELGEFLTGAAARRAGFVIKIGKIGSVPIATRTVRITGEEVTASIGKNGIVRFEVYDTTQKRYREYSPGNDALNKKFLVWVEEAIKNKKDGISYGNPGGVCFDQLQQ